MKSETLTAISPVDGRYKNTCEPLSAFFSEYGFFKYRLIVEIEYFIALSGLKLKNFNPHSTHNKKLRELYKSFTPHDAIKIKEIEKVTNHDVKAVEYYIKEEIKGTDLQEYSEFIHFGLTSQDINNTAVPMMIRDGLDMVIIPEIESIIVSLRKHAEEWGEITMLARTHGQPASPTVLGKEIMVFVERLENQLDQLKSLPHTGKFGGATGNFNAHQVAYPDVNWEDFANHFLKDSLGLKRQRYTTQIEHYDNMASIFDCLKRIGVILIDLSRDMWLYISMDYFKQKVKKGEVGSSAMPHKVNPIDFENAEGNLGLGIAIFEHLSVKLPVSRLQRDLTDSTVLRNCGVPFSHFLISLKSIQKGMDKLILNNEKIAADLDNNWAVVAEAIQTILRSEGYKNPYEALKDLTRGNHIINKDSISGFIDTLDINDEVKERLKCISPQNYKGIF